ncbi:MAG TPA: glycosyltransferase family 2 protein [Candidatus Polarisedimenticolaceae bacterium]|nr:glycosyltransferase family 2 protein [Candidatus Polarisedimenticolaceae bacterium]
MPRATLSVVVIARNEERNLGRCLDSVSWAEERIVVDGESTDRTREVAAGRGARVLVQPWLGYRDQKNVAVDAATMDWVLSLDADEWLPQETAEEVRSVLEAPVAEAYGFSRVSAVSGAFLRHTFGRDRQTRLFRRGAARFAGGEVHERLALSGGTRTAMVRGPLLHRTYRSFSDYAARMNHYSDLGARGMAGRPVSLLRLVLSPPAAFLKMYVLRGGFLDGLRGFVVAAGQAHYVLLKYAKHWEAQRRPDPEFARLVPPSPEDPDPQGP